MLILLGAPSPPLLGQEARLAARLPHGTAVEVQRLVDSAARLRLPTEPLIQKALEGESKGADSSRIMVAVGGLLARMDTARQALGNEASEAELVAGAAALRAGADPGSVHTLRTLRPNRSLFVPLSVLADLLSDGVPASQVWSSVRDMASNGASDAQFLRLRDRLGRDGADRPRPLPPAPEHAPGEASPERP